MTVTTAAILVTVTTAADPVTVTTAAGPVTVTIIGIDDITSTYCKYNTIPGLCTD